jgi:CheY-like chemotaxis protein
MTELGRILIADDESDFLSATAMFLRSRGFHCDCAPDATEAMRKLQEQDYDLLISDIEMPGNENLALIRTVPQLVEGLPIILVTGRPSIETASQSFQFSVVAYLVKPIQPEALLDTASKSVERYRAYRAITNSRRRLQNTSAELERLEMFLRAQPGNSSTPWSAFPAMTLQSILDSLRDLKDYTEVITRQKAAHQEGSVPLIQAVQETIAILEKTKSSFKSKDLGDLRRRLENLMNQNSQIPQNSAKLNLRNTDSLM